MLKLCFKFWVNFDGLKCSRLGIFGQIKERITPQRRGGSSREFTDGTGFCSSGLGLPRKAVSGWQGEAERSLALELSTVDSSVYQLKDNDKK